MDCITLIHFRYRTRGPRIRGTMSFALPTFAQAAPAVSAAFLSSLVEAVEALTVVLSVATVRGWRPAGLGAVAGLPSLALVVVAFWSVLHPVPLHALQLLIRVPLLLFCIPLPLKFIVLASGI